MNHEMKKTLGFVIAAVLMSGAAIVGSVDRSIRPESFNDQGGKFFDDFDPNAVTTLEVFDYDPSTLTPLPFKVTQKDGRWVIPSHYDYSADAKQRLVDTATGVIGLTKDSIRSDRVEDQEVMGVIDPLDTKNTAVKGIGKRVTLRDASDKVLADFIIGKEVKDHPEQRYVRVPGQKRIYGVDVKADLSTRFADWIETNLLKLDASKVRKVVIDQQGFNPETGTIVPGEVITIQRKDASTPWTVEGTPEGKEPNTDTLLALTNGLSDLKIAGIRPKPEGLTADLKEASGEVKPTTRQALLSLVSKGFYLTRNNGLLSNKGKVEIFTDEGVVYTLRFGEVVFATGNELSAGPAEEDKSAETEKGETPKDPAKPAEGTSEGRYLFATAAFDPSLIPPPKPSSDPDDKFPDDPFLEAAGEKPLVVESAQAKEKAEKLKAEQDKLVEAGKKRAKELSDRFAAWYYVTPGDSYRTIVQERSNLIRDKSAKPAGPAGGPGGLPPGFPGGLPGGGLPFNPHGG
ncbi:DUF4340 domain-containing protein [Tundrisphaera lichenicola]|uniref:DUF4340 domain-containing protein n=1 Tax=Tundrisphaera lichenicola TaxID=2029860 RepID=UPI003EB95779